MTSLKSKGHQMLALFLVNPFLNYTPLSDYVLYCPSRCQHASVGVLINSYLYVWIIPIIHFLKARAVSYLSLIPSSNTHFHAPSQTNRIWISKLPENLEFKSCPMILMISMFADLVVEQWISWQWSCFLLLTFLSNDEVKMIQTPSSWKWSQNKKGDKKYKLCL